MLFVENGGKIIVVFQRDHGDLAGQIAAHWGNERFAEPSPLEETVYATSLHDMSWDFWDYYPTSISDEGKPVLWYEMRKYAFKEFSRFYRIQIQGVGPNHLYAELLLAMHAAGLYKGRYGTQPSHLSLQTQRRPEWQDDLDELEKIQEQVKQQLLSLPNGSNWVSEKILWTNYRLLEVWDRLSQFIIGRDENITNGILDPVPLSYSGDQTQLKLQRGKNEGIEQRHRSVMISPYPFASNPATFYLTGFVIPNKQYSNEKDLAKSILRAQRIQFEIATSGTV